jgi:hypothetical protein
MAGLEQNYLREGVVSSYIAQPHDERLEQLADINVGLATYGLSPEEVDAVLVKVPSIQAGLDFYCGQLGQTSDGSAVTVLQSL